MNKNNVLKLADHLEKMPDKAFSMRSWLFRLGSNNTYQITFRSRAEVAEVVKKRETTHDCGAVACIAGSAALMAAAEGAPYRDRSIRRIATDWLDLTFAQADRLFIPEDPRSHGVMDYPRQTAIKTLRHLAETGRVKWGWPK